MPINSAKTVPRARMVSTAIHVSVRLDLLENTANMVSMCRVASERLFMKLMVTFPVGKYKTAYDIFSLILCFIDVDDCLSSDCASGTTCVDGINQYTCICPEGFTGKHCESGKEERRLHVSALH